MNTNLALLRQITRGAVRIARKGGAYEFYRMTDAQMAAYRDNPDFAMKARAASGIRIECQTDANAVALTGLFRQGSSRSYAGIDVFLNGVMIRHEETENFHEQPEISFEIPLDGAMNTLSVWLPGLERFSLKKLVFKDASKVLPVPVKGTVICFGDSITQGYDAHYPSLAYPNQLAAEWQVEIFNKGIGAEVFNPALLTEPDPVKPDLITVAYGTNDWSKKADAKTFRQDAAAFFKQLTVLYPGTPITAILPIWRKDRDQLKKVGTFEDALKILRQICKKFPQIKIVEGVPLVPHLPEFFEDARLHPNDSGFLFMAHNLAKQIGTSFLKK